ncbi:MAG: hypothetical protein Q8Q73_16385 [Stagnimonas sp.]|nr:hypothetical protein [Stagnimonas sp.]
MSTRATKGKRTKLDVQKDRIRGLIAAGKSLRYRPEVNTKAEDFHRSLNDILVQAREQLSPRQATAFLHWVEQQTGTQLSALKGKPVAHGLSKAALRQRARSLSEELVWVARRIQEHYTTINSFRDAANELETAAIRADWTAAIAKLDDIEARFGPSFWLIESRIAIEQSRAGLESQKQLAAKIRKNGPRGLWAFISRYVSVRNEPTTALNSFYSDILERLNRSAKTNAELAAFLKFRFVWNETPSQRTMAGALVIAQGFSIVDLYETFIAICQSSYVWTLTGELQDELKNCIDILKDVRDFRLQKLSLLLGAIPLTLPTIRRYQASDLFLRGQSRSALKSALRELAADPRDYQLCILAASVINNPVRVGDHTDSRWPIIIRQLSATLSVSDTYQSDLLDLEKSLRNWTFSPASLACFYFASSIFTDDLELRLKYRRLAALNGAYLDACEINLYPHAVIKALRVDNQENPSTTFEIYDDLNQGRIKTTVASEFATYFGVELAVQALDVAALERFDDFSISTNHRPLIAFARRSLIAIYIESENIQGLLDSTSDAYFSINLPIHVLPVQNGVQSLKWRNLKSFSQNISLPIVMHMAWRQTSDENAASNVRAAVDAFFKSLGIRSFDDLTTLSENHQRAQLVYLLRYVCVQDVIDMSSLLSSSRQTSEARRSICSKLIQLDPENKEVYETENFSITRSLSVQDGFRVLDSSRVHVDTGALTSWATSEWAPNIARYRALVEAGIGVSESIDDILKEFSVKGSANKFLEMPESDADQLLSDLVYQLRARFLEDESYGLDSYLSRRIRHHSMSGALRGCVENNHLVTSRDHRTTRYLPNAYWPKKIAGLTSAESYQLQSALAKFSEDFDSTVLQLKRDFFHIKSEKHPKGIFFIPISPAMFYVIRSAVQGGYSAETLCNVCLAVFWATLRPCLNEAQSLLQIHAQQQISSAFHRLRASVKRAIPEQTRYAELTLGIGHAAEEVNAQIITVADWFNRSESNQSNQAFSLEQAIDICTQSALHSYRPFNPNIEINAEPKKFISAVGLILLSDVILTLLGNIREHAHVIGVTNVDLQLETNEEMKSFRLRMESDVGPKARHPTAVARVKAAKEAIIDGSYLKRSAGDRNSGLSKIANIALRDSAGRIDFDFLGEMRFFVDVTISIPDPIYIQAIVPAGKAR